MVGFSSDWVFDWLGFRVIGFSSSWVVVGIVLSKQSGFVNFMDNELVANFFTLKDNFFPY